MPDDNEYRILESKKCRLRLIRCEVRKMDGYLWYIAQARRLTGLGGNSLFIVGFATSIATG